VHLALLVAAALLFAAPATAQEGRRVAITFVGGTCGALIAAGRDISSECQGALLVSEYTNGRYNIAFVLTDRRGLISFSGGAGRTRDGSVSNQPLDRMVLVGPGDLDESMQLDGEGNCHLPDLDAGVVTIRCEFRGTDGNFQGVFTTDGEKPDVVPF
jgi:hypothetical protein